MSTKKSELEQQQTDADEVCAFCGIAAVDDIRLKLCDGGCDIVKYCSDECQKNHREQHDKECKKRKAELREKKLFTQPDESHLGECPICCLPLPLQPDKWSLSSCCLQRICIGCCYADTLREIEGGLEHRCPFCREPTAMTDEEDNQNLMERLKANDPVAIFRMGNRCLDEGDSEGAFGYFTKAAELGHAPAHYNLSIMYHEGKGVEKDEKKAVYHAEEAAIGGHPNARYNIAYHEAKNLRPHRAAKHFIIAANLGQGSALDVVKQSFMAGYVSKEDYAAALRGYQAAVDATKSAQRERAEAFDWEL